MGTRLYCVEGKPGVTGPPTASGDRGPRTPSCSQRRTPPTSTSTNPSLPPLPSLRRTSARTRPSRRSCHTHHGWVGLVRLEGHWRRRSGARGADSAEGLRRKVGAPVSRAPPDWVPAAADEIPPTTCADPAPPLAPRPTGSDGCGTTGVRGERIHLQQFRRVTSASRRPSSSRQNSGATVRAEACRLVAARRTRAFLSPPAPASSSTR
jgi:hypothetical protein